MKDNFTPHSVKDLLIASVIAYIIYTLGVQGFPLLVFLFPSVFVVLGIKRGLLHGLLAVLTTGVLIYITNDATSALILTLFSIAIAGPMIQMLQQAKPSFNTIFLTTVIMVLLLVGAVYLTQLATQVSAIDTIEQMMKESLSGSLEGLKGIAKQVSEQSGNSELLGNAIESIEQIEGRLDQSVNLMIVRLPSTILIVALLVAAVNYYLSANILRRLGIGIIDIPKFQNFRLPQHIAKGFLISILGILLLGVVGFGYTSELSINVSMIFSFLFALQGVAVVYALLKRKLRTFGSVLIILLTFMLGAQYAYTLIGLADVFFDIRNRKRKTI